ncbi:MAG: hypothetical protein GYA23_04745 [Methanomicrobiales archaeon]|nr:hypothetical protein [Methanomicrobiales archaeon]
MADIQRVPDQYLAVAAVILSLAAAAVLYPFRIYSTILLVLCVLFFLLFLAASQKGWKLPSTYYFIRSRNLSEVFLGLLLFTNTLSVAWCAGILASRAVSDIEGIFVGLIVFGILELAIGSLHTWE